MGGMEDYYIAQFFCWREIILLNLEIDIETFSSVNLAKAGVYRYAESPDFEVLLFGYSVDGGEVKVGDQLQRIGSMEYHIESTKTNAGTRKLPMTEDVFRMFRAILEDRPTDFPEIMVDGYVGFLFRDKNGMPEVALHWEHRLKNAVNRYNSIFRVQLPKITPHICRHTYCSNQAKAGMNPKTLQYLMGHSDIGVTMNTYTHLGLDDAKNEMIRMEELEQARKEVVKAEDKKPMKQNMFKVV